MMVQIFNTVLGMSIISTVLMIVVMFLRTFGKKLFSKNIIFILWVIVIAKLLIPVTLPSPISLYNFIKLDAVDLNEMSYEENVGGQTAGGILDNANKPLGKGEDSIITEDKAPATPNISVEDNADDNNAVPTVPHMNSQPSENDTSSEDVQNEVKNGTDIRQFVGAVYCIVTAAAILTLAVSYIFTIIRLRRSRRVDDERVFRILREFRGHEKVRLVTIKGNRSIMIFGILRPYIIIPEDHTALNEEQFRYLLMHEMHHFYHGDVMWNLLMLFSVCVHWFNPIVWVMRRSFQNDLEMACDARILSSIPAEEKKIFAETLVYFAERSVKHAPIPTVAFGKNNIKERVVQVMKYKKTGTIALIISVLVIAAVIAVFATGAFNNGASDETVPPEGTSNIVEKEDIDSYIDSLAKKYDFNGESFTWIGGQTQLPEPVGETGEVMNDILYYRQRDIEDKFGVSVINYKTDHIGKNIDPIADLVKMDVAAGTGAYDLGSGSSDMLFGALALYGLADDLSTYSVIDTERDWWTPGLTDTYSFGDSVYFINGDITTSNYTDTYCVVYNKDIAEQYNIDGLYELALNGSWTFDKLYEAAEVIPANDNGSGVYRYGGADGLALMFANGISVTKYSENGFPYVEDEISAEMKEMAAEMTEVFSDSSISACLEYRIGLARDTVEEKYGYKTFADMFADGKIMFCFLTTKDVAALREKDVNFGLLPMPKGDESQQNYSSYGDIGDKMSVFVPKSAANKELSDVITEAMAALGYKYFRPAYYDVLLGKDSVRSASEGQILDIILKTKTNDMIDFIDGHDHGSHFRPYINKIVLNYTDGGIKDYAQYAKQFDVRIAEITKNLGKTRNDQ